MPIRPPKTLAPRKESDSFSSRSGQSPSSPLEDPLSAAIEHEVLAEKAATYGRLLARLEKALEALREFEEEHGSISLTADPGPSAPGLREGVPGSSPGQALTGRRAFALASLRSDERTGEDEYEFLLAAAGEALWHVVIQRDLCGFRNHELFYREYRIPAAVRLRMGLRPRAKRQA